MLAGVGLMKVPTDWIPSTKDRPRPEIDGSLLMREDISLEMIAPTNNVADIIARMLPLAEQWLQKQVGGQEAGKPSDNPKYLTCEESAPILGVSVYTVQKWCREGKIDAVKSGGNDNNGMGGKWVIPREAIDAYLNKQRLIHGEKWRSAK